MFPEATNYIKQLLTKSTSILTHLDNVVAHNDSIKVHNFYNSILESIGEDALEFGSRIGSRDNVPTSLELFQNTSVDQPSAEQQIKIVSTSADDAWGGIGINRLQIMYFTKSWERKTIQVRLDGLTDVIPTTDDFYRFCHVYASRIGSNITAQGTITFKSLDGTKTFIQIEIGTSLFERLGLYVPTGYRAEITDLGIGCSTNGGVLFRFIISEDYGDYIVPLAHESIELANTPLQTSNNLPLTVTNPDGKRIFIGVAGAGKITNQNGSGYFRYILLPIR